MPALNCREVPVHEECGLHHPRSTAGIITLVHHMALEVFEVYPARGYEPMANIWRGNDVIVVIPPHRSLGKSLITPSLELAGLPPVISAGVSYCVSTVFNYVASMRYVFAHREGLSRKREFIIFVTLSVIGLGLNEAIMWLGGRLVGDEWYMLTKVVATALVMFWNFFSRKRWLDAG